MGFDTTPKPAFLLAMQNQSWTVAGAVAELVDNSFGAGRGNADTVKITYDPSARTLMVFDNGEGMEQLGRLFQLGNTIGRVPGDIGIYGSGGTMALLWLARKVAIWTLRGGRVSQDSVDWKSCIRDDAYPVVSDTWRSASLRNTPPELLEVRHGTLIKLYLQRGRAFYPSNVQRDLAAMYAPAARHGKTLVWETLGKNGECRELQDPLEMPTDADNTVGIDITLDVDGDALSVYGKVGLIEGLPQSRSRIAIGYGHRVINRTRDCYISPDGDEKFLGAGVAGWLDLSDGWQAYLTTTKTEIADTPLWDRLMAAIFHKIRPLLERIKEDVLRIHLEGIALNLRRAVEGLHHIKVNVVMSAAERQHQGGQQEDGRAGRTKKVHEDDGDSVKQTMATPEIDLISQSDEAMEGLLCRVENTREKVIVYVNKDHYAIREALSAQPINRLMLNSLVTREIAEELANDHALRKRVFPRSVNPTLDEQEVHHRTRFIHRLLMDDACRKYADAEGLAAT
jgi:hypothetical protein